jgi:Uma2 family endonuclease
MPVLAFARPGERTGAERGPMMTAIRRPDLTLGCVTLPPTAPGTQTMVMPLPVPRLTIDMLDDFPDDGTRYELLEGMLLVTPAPSFVHQVVATRLATMLTNALRGTGATVVAVGAIQRGRHTQLQPDVLVCAPGVRPGADWPDIHAWWLAVEVLSPSSRLYDREVKPGAYLSLGVAEYWVVDPSDRSVERFSTEQPRGARATKELVWRAPAPAPEIVIDLRELFAEVNIEDGGMRKE